MDVTILVSKILGIYCVLAGLFLIFKGKSLPHMLKDFFDHPAMLYLTGVILVFLSSMYLIQYNIWDGTYKTLITVVAWATMLKGVMYIFFPEMLNDMAVKKYKNYFVVYGVLAILAGFYLFFVG